MVDKNEHPGTFKDNPEERTLHVKVRLPLDDYVEHGFTQQIILDKVIQQTVAETGYETPVEVVSSRLYLEESTYEAKLFGVGSETFFHALGGACMNNLGDEEVAGVSRRDISWRLDTSQSMQRLVRSE